MKIGYASYTKFILTLEILDDIQNTFVSDGCEETATYNTRDYKIINVEDIENKIYPLDSSDTLNMNIFNYYKIFE
jgi:hypothetical protein